MESFRSIRTALFILGRGPTAKRIICQRRTRRGQDDHDLRNSVGLCPDWRANISHRCGPSPTPMPSAAKCPSVSGAQRGSRRIG